jgi:hypothetical protein
VHELINEPMNEKGSKEMVGKLLEEYYNVFLV